MNNIPAAPSPAQARHQAAVARSLGWAHESAARGDYVDALSWMRTLDAVGHTFTATDATARAAWTVAQEGRNRP
jgi:hypothetical protein